MRARATSSMVLAFQLPSPRTRRTSLVHQTCNEFLFSWVRAPVWPPNDDSTVSRSDNVHDLHLRPRLLLTPPPTDCQDASSTDMRVPGSSCFALAFISLIQSSFPIYFSYSWASVYDDEMLNDTDNWTKCEVRVDCASNLKAICVPHRDGSCFDCRLICFSSCTRSLPATSWCCGRSHLITSW